MRLKRYKLQIIAARASYLRRQVVHDLERLAQQQSRRQRRHSEIEKGAQKHGN